MSGILFVLGIGLTARGGRYNPQRPGARTFVVTAEIDAGGPTGVYAARL